MIIISGSLVLPSGVNLRNPIFGWRNLVTITNIVADTEADDFPASDLANPATNLFWRGIVESPPVDEHLTITIDDVGQIDYVGIAAHNFGSAQIPVSLEHFDITISPPAWVELIAPFIPADDTPIIMRFLPQSIASLRIRLQPGVVAPEAAVIYAGKLLVMERGLPVDAGHTPMNFGRTANIVNGRSESANFLGRIVLGEETGTIASFLHLTNGFYRSEVRPFILASVEVPFFFAWKPEEFPGDVGYGWMTNNPQPTFDLQTGRVGIAFEMSGVT